jgi:hypothetical protein
MAHASNLLAKLSQKLFSTPSEQQQFIEALTQPQPFSPCILWCRSKPIETPFSTEPPIAWQPDFIDRLRVGEKPGQHPLHEQGYFYCLDFSSVFAISTLLSLDFPVQTVVDMCASPGGKSMFAWVLLQPSHLISNDAIGKRLGALISNFKRLLSPRHHQQKCQSSEADFGQLGATGGPARLSRLYDLCLFNRRKRTGERMAGATVSPVYRDRRAPPPALSVSLQPLALLPHVSAGSVRSRSVHHFAQKYPSA